MSKFHITEPKHLLSQYSGLDDTICAPGRNLLFQESMDGAKVKYIDGKMEPSVDRKRPYHIFLLTDAIVVGKELSGMLSTSYRAKAYPLRKCDLWVPSSADSLSGVAPHVLRVRCAGKLMYDVDTGSTPTKDTDPRLSMSIEKSDDGDSDFLLYCYDADQRERLYSTFQYLKRKIVPAAADHRRSGTFATPHASSPAPLPSAQTPISEDVESEFKFDDTVPDRGRVRAHARLRHSMATVRHSSIGAPSLSSTGGTPAGSDATPEIASFPTRASAADSLKELETRLRGSVAPSKPEDGSSYPGKGVMLNVSALPAVPAMSAAMGTVDEAATKRHETYVELLETEKAYVSDLQILIKTYQRPLEIEANGPTPFVSSATVLGLFSNASSILDVHAELLQEICTAFSEHADKRLSEVFSEAFSKLVPFFRLYTVYCRNYWLAIDVYKRETSSNDKFNKFLYTCSLKPETRKQDIMSFLIKPVQRICRYPLLFKELLKYMDEGHPNRERLHATYEEVQKIAGEVNDRVKAQERQRRIFDVYTLLDGSVADLVQPQRKFLADIPELTVMHPNAKEEGALALFGSSSSKSKRMRLFLFTDLAILAQQTHTAKVDSSLGTMQIPGEEGPLPGILSGQRYKAVDQIAFKDMNLAAMQKATSSTATEGGRPLSMRSESVECSALSFDILANKQVPAKDGTSVTTVLKITLTFASEKEKYDTQTLIMDAITKCQANARDLQERQMQAAPNRTRNWRKNAGTWGGPSSSKDGISRLESLQGRYAVGVEDDPTSVCMDEMPTAVTPGFVPRPAASATIAAGVTATTATVQQQPPVTPSPVNQGSGARPLPPLPPKVG